MSHVGKRLKEIRAILESSQTHMARTLGIAQSTLSQIESEHSQPSFDVLSRLAARYAINLNWLILGDGDMFIRQPEAPTQLQTLLNIPMVHHDAKASYANSRLQENAEDITDNVDGSYRIPGFEQHQGRRLFEVSGDSMRPTFSGGDIVLCSKVEDMELLEHHTLAVVVTPEEVLLKRTSPTEGGDVLVLRSDNPAYQNQTVKMDRVVEFWAVEMRMTRSIDDAVFKNGRRLSRLERDLSDLRVRVNTVTQSEEHT